jgi:Xaa-Pro dipeptidase
VHDVGYDGSPLYGMQEKSWAANFHLMIQDSSSASVLEPNMVITVEPGMYVPEPASHFFP